MPSTKALRSEPNQRHASVKERLGRQQNQRNVCQGVAAPIASTLRSFPVFHLMAIGFTFLNNYLEVKCTKCGCTYTVDEMEHFDDDELNRRHAAVNQNCSVLAKIRTRYHGQLRSPGVNHPSAAYTHAYSSAGVACTYSEQPSLTTKSVRPQDDIISDSFPGRVFTGNGPSSTTSPAFINYKDRLASFSSKGYGRSMNCKPEQLAEAGLYACKHQGRDAAKCFACDIVIYELSDKEDVWVKHAQLSPTCYYINQQKGQGFVDKVVNDMMNVAPKRKPINKEDVVNLGIDASWMKTIMEMGFTLDDLVLVYLYKKSLQPEKPVVFSDIQEPVHMILFQKDEAESNFSKFESQWPTGEESDPGQMNSSVTDSSAASNSTSLKGEDVETDSGYELPGEHTPCKICYSKRADIVLRPCCHMVSCESCTQKLKNCPICRRPIQGIMPVDF